LSNGEKRGHEELAAETPRLMASVDEAVTQKNPTRLKQPDLKKGHKQ
jgi:hypothetical protein